jgi:hypothetical protein
MTLRTRVTAPALLLLAALASAAHAAKLDAAKSPYVLLLGDRGHHVPAERAAQLVPALASRGIDVTYTERIDDLNLENLRNYDEVYDSRPKAAKGLEPLEYEEAGGKISNYLPGRNFGNRGDPNRTMQEPLDTAKSIKHLTRQSRNQKAVHYLVPVSDSPNPFGASTDSLSPTHY